jgi:hypothetical protein
MLTQRFHIGKQVFGGVECHVGGGIGRAGHAVTTSALVQQHNPEHIGIKPLMSSTRLTASRATVDDQNGAAMWIASSLPSHPVAVTDIEQPPVVHLRLGKNLSNGHALTLVNGLKPE